MELNKIYNMDCMDGMKLLKDNSIDLIITSPPYNLNHNKRKNSMKGETWNRFLVMYNDYNDDMTPREYFHWQVDFLNECYRVLKNDGAIYYNHKEKHIDSIYTHPNDIFRESKMNILQNIIWFRMGGFGFNCGRFVDSHEIIVVGYKEKPKFIKVGTNCKHKLDVWNISPNVDKEHPASFPIDIPDNIIKAYKDYEGLIVLDPFMGSGTTAIASIINERKFIGFEVDKKYVDMAEKKIEEHKAQISWVL